VIKLIKTADIVIIGGGISGCSIAYNLAKKGVLNEISLNDLKKVNLSLESDNLNYHQRSEEHWDKYDNLNRKYKKLNSNVKDLIKENEIMTNILEKNNLIPEFNKNLKNEKENEITLRRKKRQDLEL